MFSRYQEHSSHTSYRRRTTIKQEPYLLVSDGACRKWVTLSHCWGTTSQPLRTTTNSFEKHRKTLPLSALPLTFRDAITITRPLGYRYIWIDSLCIVQNSQADWLYESSRMQYVYKNAVFNIAAQSSSNPNDGIFNPANEKRQSLVNSIEIPCYLPPHRTKGTILTRQTKIRGDRYLSGPLSKRAWVLQEEVLSPRVLRYYREQLTWTCRSLNCNEGDPETNYDRFGQSKMWIFGIPENQDQQSRLLRWWYEIVSDFWNRIIYISDRFQAISALAREFQVRTG